MPSFVKPLRIAASRGATRLFAAADRLRGHRQDYLFVMAHMRSGSSLLLHLLASNPDIAGCGERNAVYRARVDLHRLSLEARRQNGRILRPPKYVVDQINHSSMVPSGDLLVNQRMRCVFLLREPAGAISSMLDVLQRHYGTQYKEAALYYRDRLADLAHYSELTKQKAFVLLYEDLLLRPDKTLQALGRFLGLQTSLTSEYRVFDFTGKRGDPSSKILAGRILANDRPTDERIPAADLQILSQDFDNVLATLKRNCNTIDSV